MGLKTYLNFTEDEGYLNDIKGTQLKEFFDCMAPTVVHIQHGKQSDRYHSSGVIIAEGRFILTCAHGLDDDSTPSVLRFSQKRSKKASIYRIDRDSDLCILEYNQKNLDYAELYHGDDIDNIGQEVYTISMSAGLCHVFTSGKIAGSGTYGELESNTFGNKSQPMFLVSDISSSTVTASGAPVFDARGRVLGIRTHDHFAYKVVNSGMKEFLRDDVIF